MADAVLPEPFTSILLIEGEDDFDFFLSLLKALRLNNIIHLYRYRGRDNLASGLVNVVNNQRFEELKHLGIVRDADFDTDALSSVRSSIDRVNRKLAENWPGRKRTWNRRENPPKFPQSSCRMKVLMECSRILF